MSADLRQEQATDTSGGLLGLACAATFLAFCDAAVVNLAFPAIQGDFLATPQTTLSWIVSGYAVAFAATLAAAGRAADTLGRRRFLLAGVVVFALASLGCAVAPSVAWLIASRVIQGLGAALLLPASLGALLVVTPPARTAAAVGTWGAATALAAATGPAVGAAFVQWWGWRSIFLVNVPACAVLGVVTLVVVRREPRTGRGLPDLLGVTLLAAGTAAFVAAVTESHSWGYTSPLPLVLGTLGVAGVVGAAWRSNTHQRPALAVHLWSHRSFAGANAINAVLGVCLFAHLLALPLFLTSVWQMALLKAAVAIGITGVAAMFSAGLVGRYATAQNARWYTAAGMAAITAEFAVLASPLWTTERSWALWIVLAVTAGLGVGAASNALAVLTAAAIPVADTAAGMGMTLTARQVGGAVGVAVLAAILDSTVSAEFATSFHHLFAVLGAAAAAAAVASVAALRFPAPQAQEPALQPTGA